MYVTISVGHRVCVAVIPTEQIYADELRDVFTGMVVRLDHLVRGRVKSFDLCLMGNKVNSGTDLSENGKRVARAIVSAVRFGEFLRVDHVTFHRTPNLMQHIEDSIVGVQKSFDMLVDAGVEDQGMKIELGRELARLNGMRLQFIEGISAPENFWV